MKIISKGLTTNDFDSLVRFTCPVCDSRLEEWKKNLTPVMLEDKLHFGFICPVCKGQVAVQEGELESVRSVSCSDEELT